MKKIARDGWREVEVQKRLFKKIPRPEEHGHGFFLKEGTKLCLSASLSPGNMPLVITLLLKNDCGEEVHMHMETDSVLLNFNTNFAEANRRLCLSIKDLDKLRDSTLDRNLKTIGKILENAWLLYSCAENPTEVHFYLCSENDDNLQQYTKIGRAKCLKSELGKFLVFYSPENLAGKERERCQE